MIEAPFEQHLLIADHDVAHGIEPKDGPERPLNGAVNVQDRGTEKPEVKEMAEYVGQIPEVNGERRQGEGHTQSQNHLNQKGQRKEKSGWGKFVVPDHKEEQYGQGQEKVEEVGDHADRGKNFGRKKHLLQKASAAHQDHRPFENRGLEETPGENSAGEEEKIRLHFRGSLPGQHVGEHHAVGQQMEQGIDEAPDEAENAPAVAGLELTRDKALDERPVAIKRSNLGEDRWPRAQAPLVLDAADRRATART